MSVDRSLGLEEPSSFQVITGEMLRGNAEMDETKISLRMLGLDFAAHLCTKITAQQVGDQIVVSQPQDEIYHAT